MIHRKSTVLNAQTLLEFALVKRIILADEYVSGDCISACTCTHAYTKSESAFQRLGIVKKLLLLLIKRGRKLFNALAIGLGGIHVLIHFSDRVLSTYPPKSTRL